MSPIQSLYFTDGIDMFFGKNLQNTYVQNINQLNDRLWNSMPDIHKNFSFLIPKVDIISLLNWNTMGKYRCKAYLSDYVDKYKCNIQCCNPQCHIWKYKRKNIKDSKQRSFDELILIKSNWYLRKNKIRTHSLIAKFFLCKGCRVAKYCSKKCQKIHWNLYNHKLQCQKSKTIS